MLQKPCPILVCRVSLSAIFDWGEKDGVTLNKPINSINLINFLLEVEP